MGQTKNKYKVDQDAFYIRVSDSQAFCKPTLSFKDLSSKEQDILMSAAHTGG